MTGMKRLLGPCFGFALAAGCSEIPTATPDFAKAGPAPNTPLQITLGQGLGGTDAIRADDIANTPYTDGQGGTVGAHINGPTGNLKLWTSQYGTPPARLVKVLATSFDGFTSDRIYTNSHTNPGGDNSQGLRGMVIGSTGSAVLEAELDNDGIVRYGKKCDGSADAATRAVTTHPTATTWTISGTGGIHCKQLSSKPTLTQVGTTGPFSMALLKI